MLNSSMSYPYPVIRPVCEDYKTTTFNAKIHKENREDGFELKVEYCLDNGTIQALIDNEQVTFAVQIQCTATWYRKLYTSNKNEQVLFIPSKDVHERVEICPCIIAKKTITNEDFSNDDFEDEFKDITYNIKVGEVIGIGDRYRFNAIYKDDILEKGDPIVHFKMDEKASLMHCEWENENIIVHLPRKQWDEYTQIGEYEQWKHPILNAIYVTPVIVQAICEIANTEENGGESSLSSYMWYKTLDYFLKKEAGDNQAEYKKLLADPVRTTQLLLNDNSFKSVTLLSQLTRPTN